MSTQAISGLGSNNILSGPGYKSAQSAVLLSKPTPQTQSPQNVPNFVKKINEFIQRISPGKIEDELKKGIDSELVQKAAKIFKCSPVEALDKLNKACSKTKSIAAGFKTMAKNCKAEIINFAKCFKK